jgi:hypothetical protein
VTSKTADLDRRIGETLNFRAPPQCTTCGSLANPFKWSYQGLCACHAAERFGHPRAKRKPKAQAVPIRALLYTPPPLDDVGLRILAELRGIQGGKCWKSLGRVKSLSYAMGILGQSAAKGDDWRDMRGYAEVRRGKVPGHVEFRLTGVGEAELDRLNS